MPVPSPPPGPAAGDPSMEEILASIRKILDEEEGGTKPAGPAAAAAASASPSGPEVVRAEEVPLELTEEMIVAAPQPAPPSRTDPLVTEAETIAPAPPPDSDLVAPATAAAATALIGQLAQAVARERAAPVTRSGPSIEDVVREEIRPILRDWLDAHLPPLVERLVRAEIERLVGRTMG